MTAAIARYVDARAKRSAGPRPPIAQLREHFAPGGVAYPIPRDVAIEPVDAAGVSAHWVTTPAIAAPRVVLFLHGGGYHLGSMTSHGELVARIGRAAQARVLFLDYRLAPEHPFPAAVDDALAAYRWLRRSTSDIVLAGDSAGGGLAMALMVALRDAGDPLPGAAAVMSPWVDLALSGSSFLERAADDPVLTPELLRGLAAGYLHTASPRDPLVSPLHAELSRLPPLLIQVGSREILFSDADRLATAMRAAGGDVTLEVGDGLTHVYQTIGDAPEAIAATDRIGTFLRTSHTARS
jgi:epsilon-lactone hydrolase